MVITEQSAGGLASVRHTMLSGPFEYDLRSRR